MATMATGCPSLSSTACRITAVGMATPTVAMSTAEDWVGCLSHFARLKRVRDGREDGASTTLPDRDLTGASAGIGGAPRADAGGLHVDGIHVSRVQDMGLLHLPE